MAWETQYQDSCVQICPVGDNLEFRIFGHEGQNGPRRYIPVATINGTQHKENEEAVQIAVGQFVRYFSGPEFQKHYLQQTPNPHTTWRQIYIERGFDNLRIFPPSRREKTYAKFKTESFVNFL